MNKYKVTLDLYGDESTEEVLADSFQHAADMVLWLYQEIFSIRGAIVKFIWIIV